MNNSYWILKATGLILIAILIMIIAITQIEIINKLDKLIELNTPEFVNVIPEDFNLTKN
jgi:hypothetical protein